MKNRIFFLFGSGLRDIRGDRIEQRHQRVNFSPSTGLFGDKNGVTFRLHPGIADTVPSGLVTMHQHPFSQFALGGFNGPAQFPAPAYPHHNSVGDPGFRQ